MQACIAFPQDDSLNDAAFACQDKSKRILQMAS
jgi:hypothetical protein